MANGPTFGKRAGGRPVDRLPLAAAVTLEVVHCGRKPVRSSAVNQTGGGEIGGLGRLPSRLRSILRGEKGHQHLGKHLFTVLVGVHRVSVKEVGV